MTLDTLLDRVADYGFANIQARNRVLSTNPPVAINNITPRGSSWLWAVTTLLSLLFLTVLAITMGTRHRQRVYHYLALALLLIPTIAYFTMASNLGAAAVPVEFGRGRNREVFWVRYIDWSITWPIIVLALLLMTAVGWSTVLFTMGLAALYAIMFLAGAFTATRFKWGYFVFAIFIYFLLIYQLLHVARPWARRYETSKYYFPLAAYILFLWLLYPVAWGLSEGGNAISNDGECVFYGVLDIFSKGLFALGLAIVAERLDFKRLGLWMNDNGRIATGYGDDGQNATAQEKTRPRAASGAVRDSGVAYEPYGTATETPRGAEPTTTAPA